MRRIIDLPQPDGPRSATTSDPPMETLTSSSTRSLEPPGRAKSCDTFRASQSAYGIGGEIPTFKDEDSGHVNVYATHVSR